MEDTLNGLLEEKGDGLVGAERYERMAGREAYRAGHYDRKLVITSGEVTMRMSKLKRKLAAGKLKAIYAQESFEASAEKALRVVDDLESMRLREAARVVREGYAETPHVHALPGGAPEADTYEQRHRAAQPEIGRRTRVVGTFPDDKSALMLVTVRLKYVAESEWGSRRYLDVSLLEG